MKVFVVAIRDSAVNAYMPPWCAPAQQAAIRAFSDEIQKADSPMARHPSDYELFHVGYWEDTTGEMEPLKAPELMARAKDLLKQSS